MCFKVVHVVLFCARNISALSNLANGARKIEINVAFCHCMECIIECIICFASLCILCCTLFSPIKQLDVSTPVFQEETVDSPAPSNLSGETDGMQVSTDDAMTRQHTPQTNLQPEAQGTAVLGVKSSFFARYLSRRKNSIGAEKRLSSSFHNRF